ncbi:MAG: hypothetical protein V1706_14880 [Pseudomonadota bacterium]
MNDCQDPESWARWQGLLQHTPDDDGIYSAYALRLGLCRMVEKKKIDPARASMIFEYYMNSLIATKKGRKEAAPEGRGKI